MIFVTDKQRQALDNDGVPTPLIDGDGGKCYMIMPVELSIDGTGSFFQARMQGFGAVAEAEVPSDAVVTLAILIRKMMEENSDDGIAGL